MATVEDATRPGAGEHNPPALAPAPELFHFGLRHLFGFVSGLAALLGAMALIRGGWAVALAFGAAMVFAHVLATFVGTRLRDASPDLQQWLGAGGLAESAQDAPAHRWLTPEELAALTATPLAKHESAPRRTIVAGVAGLLAGGFVGAAGIPLIAGPGVTAAGLTLGAASCGVIGAWLALLAAHFLSVARRTWRDANADPARAAAQQRPRRLFGYARRPSR